MTSSYETDTTRLAKLIALPFVPQEARWRASEQGVRTGGVGPTDFELVAVLKFDDASIERLKDQMAEQASPNTAYVAKSFVQPWFPDAIRTLFVTDPAHPDYLDVAVQRLDPAPFKKGSLQDGFVVIVGNDMLLYLHTI